MLSGTASDTDQAFYRKFGDAQKYGFASGGGSGWYFWSWKMNPGQGNHLCSYVDAVQQGCESLPVLSSADCSIRD